MTKPFAPHPQAIMLPSEAGPVRAARLIAEAFREARLPPAQFAAWLRFIAEDIELEVRDGPAD